MVVPPTGVGLRAAVQPEDVVRDRFISARDLRSRLETRAGRDSQRFYQTNGRLYLRRDAPGYPLTKEGHGEWGVSDAKQRGDVLLGAVQGVVSCTSVLGSVRTVD